MAVVGSTTVEDTSDAVNWGYVNCPPNDVVGGALLVLGSTGLVRLTGSIGGDLVCGATSATPAHCGAVCPPGRSRSAATRSVKCRASTDLGPTVGVILCSAD